MFPNTFEYFFVAVELIKASRNPFRLNGQRIVALAAGIWICIKLPQEWWIHMARLDLTDIVKVHLFGAPVTSPWGEAIRNRPLVAGAVLVLGVRLLSRRLPPGDWKPTLSADAQALHLGWPSPAREAVPSAFFGWPFVEKAALVSLVTLIFGQILPGAAERPPDGPRYDAHHRDQHVHQPMAGPPRGDLALDRDPVPRHGGLEHRDRPRHGLLWPVTGPRMPVVTLLFLIALLTLMVVLFDRSKLIGRGRGPRIPAAPVQAQ